MKKLLYESKKSVFSNWLSNYCLEKKLKCIWAQICYDWNTGELLHVVFEKNSDNEHYIQWPVDMPELSITNIDFTTDLPTLESGELWDYRVWHKKALGCVLKNEPTEQPISFWDWREKTEPQGNATCDLDFFCKTVEGEYIGIEATEIYYVETSHQKNKDSLEHLQRLLTKRKGNSNRPGFNLRQLQAQKKFVQIFEGRMFMLFHQILKAQEPYCIREDKCLLLEINDENHNAIKSIVDPSSVELNKSAVSCHIEYAPENPIHRIKESLLRVSLQKIFDRFMV
ncbi:hypothetical protein QC823_01530 [Halomonas vilamensis]|uniref:Uncharacterized protein n=1 Tax=Vreelandella vilamensis TaxID=531309 RepID=A0ABU1H079_9GAMM|nr:hypothetical protein [Halomonas vilamensis]MDR5897678.1 hypothetical protein [Halomonas vilamensis]